MRVPIKVDLHMPNFNHPGVGPDQLFDKIVEITDTLESSGFSSVSVMDHLHQIAPAGPPENWMLEGSTILAAIAARTTKLSLGLLVGSVTYRNPALAAKITSTIDVISKGRAWHGVGAGWFEAEHIAYGFDFPPLKTRFEMLEEALQIYKLMFRGDAGTSGTFKGEYFRVEEPFNNPRPIRGDLPILIGGSGERKTLRLVAKYGDGCNLFGDPERAKHLLGVLAGHCEDVGRDYDEIAKTAMTFIVAGPTHEAAQAAAREAVEHGLPKDRVEGGIIGDGDTIGERLQALKDVGIEGVTFPMGNAHDLEAVAIAGRAASAVFGS